VRKSKQSKLVEHVQSTLDDRAGWPKAASESFKAAINSLENWGRANLRDLVTVEFNAAEHGSPDRITFTFDLQWWLPSGTVRNNRVAAVSGQVEMDVDPHQPLEPQLEQLRLDADQMSRAATCSQFSRPAEAR
jgi:hypothetical protein